MKINRLRSLISVTAAALLASAVSASALVVISSGGSSSNGASTFDASDGYGAYTPSGAGWATNPTYTPPPASADGITLSPFSDNTPYFLVAASGVPTGQGGVVSPATLTFGSAQTSFDLLWGSIDTYNTLTFGGGSGGPFVITHTQLSGQGIALGAADGDGNYNIAYKLNFLFTGGDSFKTVTFATTQNAFEFATPIPLPAAAWLLIAGLGGLGVVARRRKTSDA